MRLTFERPGSIHQWRQCDGPSMALLFHQDGNPIWEPAIHNQLNGEGKAGGEFPITYYIAGKLYSLFGFHESILRSLHLLILLTGVFVLLHATLQTSSIPIISVFPFIFFFNSPTLLFYADNFLPDGPGLGFSLMGLALSLLYFQQGKRVTWYLAATAFSLSMLVKISMVFPFIAIVILEGCYHFWPSTDERYPHWGKSRWSLILAGIVIVFIPSIIWYVYIQGYNEANHGLYFLTAATPFWNDPPEQLWQTWIGFRTYWLPVLWPKINQYILIGSIMFFIAFSFRKKQSLSLLVTLLALGSLAYALLFFHQFQHHDYYYLTLMILPLMITVSVTQLLAEILTRASMQQLKLGAVLVLSILSLRSSQASIYLFKDSYLRWFEVHTFNASLNDLEPWLEDHGISKSDKVICLPDMSPNQSLYLMNRKGWTGLTGLYDSQDVESVIHLGAKYAIITDTTFAGLTFLQYHITDTIGYHGNIGVYKID
ncbi:MAG: glycosyltransferase family 39 protein [Flavobacteriales bacterium]